MVNKRVAVTGLGVSCSLGNEISEFWSNLCEGKSGISLVPLVEHLNLPIKMGSYVPEVSIPEDVLSKKEQDRYDRFVLFALSAALKATQDARLEQNFLDEHSESIGSILGVGMGGFPITEKSHSTYLEKGPRRVSPFFIPSIIPNMASGLISLKLNLKGMNYTISSACASSGHAIAQAFEEIRTGRHKIMVTGGAESTLCVLPYSGFASMKALSKNPDPNNASRPFDAGRDGFVMGEGAGVLILEDYDHAVQRGAHIYAEVAGFGSTSDAHHITAPHPEGLGGAACMKKALKMAQISPEEVQYVNAHGTSTPLGDIAETKAIKEVFGAHAHKLKVSSTKSMVGHLLGASGGVEAIATIKTLETGIVHPTINLNTPDPQCDLDYVPNKAQKIDARYAISNSFGFGGTNATLVFKK